MNESSLLDILRQRRSIRTFQQRSVEPEKIELLKEAALRAPTSRGRNPWSFIVVTDPAVLGELGRAKEHGAEFLSGAPLAIVVAADPQRCDVWIEDCSIAAFSLQLTAVSLGLGSCWAQIRLRQKGPDVSSEGFVKNLLGLPEGHAVCCVIGIGYSAENKTGHPAKSLPWERLHLEKYGNRG